MKKGTWIITVLAAVLVFAACQTSARAVENINKNEASFRTAKRLFEMKMYEQARKILLEMKESDPTDKNVQELLAKTEAGIGKKNISHKAKPVTGDVLETVIKEVDFSDARLDEVTDYLSARCKVNIILSAEAKKTLNMEAAAAMNDELADNVFFDEGAEGEDYIPEVQSKDVIENDIGGITIRLKDVPLKAVLKYILQMKGLTYIVEDYAIVIVPKDYVPEDEMEIRIFKLYSGSTGDGAQLLR